MIGQTISQYRIEEQLGEGGMGIVYRAVDTKLDRDVALKFLPPKLSTDPDSKTRFVQEAKAASGFDHPNICTIYDIGETDDGRLFIAMAFYEGQTLKYELQSGPMTPERAASVGAQIADGLRKAHAANMVHRDIKPANIMVTTEGRVKILDFGVAKLAGGADLTKEGSTVGTTAYMSPEQARGEPVDARADLWSLGVLLYEMLSGSKPFGGEYEQAVFYSVLNESPNPLPDSVPSELADVVEKLLTKSSEDRFQSAEDALRALEPWTDSRVQTAVHHETVPKAPPLIPNWLAAVAGGILIVAVLVWLFVPKDGPSLTPPTDDFDHVAVLPFTVQGDESIAYLRDGMVTLLSGMLDGAGPIRAIDVNRVRGYIERNPNSVIDPEGGQTIAAELGADRYVIGTVVQAGTEKQLEATLYDVTGARLGGGQTAFSNDDTFMPAVDALARQLIAGQLENPDTDLSTLATETTTSVVALKNYLLAEQALRNSEWDEAVRLSDAAIAEDSTFALAWYAKSEAQGWIPDFPGRQVSIFEAYKYVDRLEGSARFLIEASYFFDADRPREAERLMRQMVREYPTDLRGIGSLAETILHYGPWFLKGGNPEKEAWKLFNKVIELDPTNDEYQYHLAHSALYYGGTALLDSLITVVEGDKAYYELAKEIVEFSESELENYIQAESDLAIVYDAFEFLYQIGDMGRASKVIEDLQSRNFDFSTQTAPEVLIAPTAYGAAGRLSQREDFFDSHSSPEYGTHRLIHDVYEAVLPGFECCSRPLEEMQAAVADWDAGDPATYISPYFTWHEAVRDYLQGLLSWRAGNVESLKEYSAKFSNEWSSEEPIVESLGHELRGLVAWVDGDLDGALEHFDRVQTDYEWSHGFSSIPGRPTWMFFVAEIMTQLDRPDEVIKYLELLRWMAAPQFTVPATLRQAEMYELDGDLEAAMRRYERVLKMWSGADAELQSTVDHARTRRDELLARLGREPGELPSPSN